MDVGRTAVMYDDYVYHIIPYHAKSYDELMCWKIRDRVN